MNTFDKKDLITWANREKANAYENYYFADSISGMQKQINNDKSICMLIEINDDRVQMPFRSDDYVSYACILPVDAVKGQKKKYRPCKTFKEMYELLNNGEFDMDENECIHQLIDFTVHTKNKKTGKEYYSKIENIGKYKEYYILIACAGHSLLDLFNKFEIEVNGEWVPFGVLE